VREVGRERAELVAHPYEVLRCNECSRARYIEPKEWFIGYDPVGVDSMAEVVE
jgi:hypothetical protein